MKETKFKNKFNEFYKTFKNIDNYRFCWSDEKLDELIDFILQEKNLEYYLSEEQLSRDIINAIIKFKKENNSYNYIVDRIKKIVFASLKEFICLVPVYGIHGTPKCLDKIKFYPSSEKNKIIKKYSLYLSNAYDVYKKCVNISTDFLIIKVKSTYLDAANFKSIELVDTLFNAVQILFAQLHNPVCIGIRYFEGEKNNMTMPFFTFNKGIGTAIFPKYSEFSVNFENFSDKENTFLKIISDIIFKRANNPKSLKKVEKNIYIAINDIGSSFNETNRGFRVIKLMSGIEALVELKEDNNIANNVAQRVSKIFAEAGCNYDELYNKMKVLYNKRSRTSHGEEKYIFMSDLEWLIGIARGLCNYFVFNKNKFMDNNALKEKLDSLVSNK